MNVTKLFAGATVAFASTAGAGVASAANLLANGDFEAPPSPANGAILVYGGGESFTGWSVMGPAGNAVDLVNANYAETNIVFNAESGLTSIDLTGAGNTGPSSGISQSVTTIVGRTYDLSFWVGNADGSGNSSYLLPSTVNLSINGGPSQAFTNSNTTQFRVNWLRFTTSFVAGGASTNLAFFNGTPLADDEAGLDNVLLTTAAVPEPAAWAMMLLGIGLGGGLLRLRTSTDREFNTLRPTNRA